MDRDSGVARITCTLLIGAALIWTFGAGTAVCAESATPADDAAVTSAAGEATPAGQPRRARERRRATEPAEVTRSEPTAAATPPTDAAAATLAAQTAETVEAKIVCKNVKLTGTKISRRTCGTPEQWAAQSEKTTDNAQEAMRQVRDRSSIVVSQPQNPLGAPGGGN
jgi:hypothetical protein